MIINDTPSSAPRATLRRSFAEMDWESFLAFVWLFAVAAHRGENAIITRVAGGLLSQVAGRIGAGEATDFQFDCAGDHVDTIEAAITQLAIVSLHLRKDMIAWEFLIGLGDVLQAEFLSRRDIKMPIGPEYTGQQPN